MHRRGSVEEVVDDGITGFHAGVIDALAERVSADVPGLVVRPESQRLFQAEAEVMAQLSTHPYIVTIYHAEGKIHVLQPCWLVFASGPLALRTGMALGPADFVKDEVRPVARAVLGAVEGHRG